MSECKTNDKVAIIVPYRDRDEHLRYFLNHLHPFLQRQQLDYQIYVVEQLGHGLWNKGILFNVGFKYVQETSKNYWNCYIFHDVDHIPDTDYNLYACPAQGPRHMSLRLDKFEYKRSYGPNYFGGSFAISPEHYQLINGFSNEFWGWGYEDDDIRDRVLNKKLTIERYSPDIGR